MADTFIQVNTGDVCPEGKRWSEILQRCMSKDDYIQAIKDAVDTPGSGDLAYRLRNEAIDFGVIDPTGEGQTTLSNIINSIITGDWSFAVAGILPIVVGLVGLVLVIIAVSSWVNAREIKIAGMTLPKVK